jgi:hypothetical protein
MNEETPAGPAEGPMAQAQTSRPPDLAAASSGARDLPDPGAKRRQSWLTAGVVAAGVVAAGVGTWYVSMAGNLSDMSKAPKTSVSPMATGSAAADALLSKNYGNKYANGLLPVGDGKYETSGPKLGYVYACSGYASNLAQGGGGASTRGPWFTNNNTQYDLNKKVAVRGHVMWTQQFAMKLGGGTRTITTNDFPSHYTGVFPISESDPAYSYDRNPNSIKSQSLTYALPQNPTESGANCMGGQVGVMLTGVALFNAFDAGGRDAGAWEVQDGCSGHPEKTGEYHYHTLSSCITDTGVQTVIGFALDGFPITGPKVGPNNYLTTSDLDECHGIRSTVQLDGKTVTIYHYVMTQDFPYSVSCFRGTAIQPPGLQSGGGTAGSATGSNLPQGTPPPRQLPPPRPR